MVERTVPPGLWPEERPRGSKDSGQDAGPEGRAVPAGPQESGAPLCHRPGDVAWQVCWDVARHDVAQNVARRGAL